jgi:hypothetical protein
LSDRSLLALLGRLLVLPAIALLAACRPPVTQRPVISATPAPNEADAKVVLGFLSAYGHRDLEAMMRCLAEDALFHGSGTPLTKPQIREFFRDSFQKHSTLRVDVGPLVEIQGTLQVRVKVETEAIWTDTWIFSLKNHKIHAYSLASGKR